MRCHFGRLQKNSRKIIDKLTKTMYLCLKRVIQQYIIREGEYNE